MHTSDRDLGTVRERVLVALEALFAEQVLAEGDRYGTATLFSDVHLLREEVLLLCDIEDRARRSWYGSELSRKVRDVLGSEDQRALRDADLRVILSDPGRFTEDPHRIVNLIMSSGPNAGTVRESIQDGLWGFAGIVFERELRITAENLILLADRLNRSNGPAEKPGTERADGARRVGFVSVDTGGVRVWTETGELSVCSWEYDLLRGGPGWVEWLTEDGSYPVWETRDGTVLVGVEPDTPVRSGNPVGMPVPGGVWNIGDPAVGVDLTVHLPEAVVVPLLKARWEILAGFAFVPGQR